MRPVFPPWSNTAFRVALAAVALGLAAAVVAPMIWVRTPWRRDVDDPVAQPVEFDHRHHVQDDGIDCRYCHDTVDRSANASIPSTAKCMGCHGQIWIEGPQLARVRDAYFSGRPIWWNRVYQLPDFVFFNHEIHVSKGVGCSSCHGRVDRMARVYQVPPLTMAWCLDCHRSPERHLRPLDRITDMTWVPEEHPREAIETAEKLGGVRHLTNCTSCHR